jgi:cyclic pyranopterin phosphate synthase
MPEGEELSYILSQELLTKSELLTLLKEVFIPLGFSKFRLTGGEPLLRPDIVEIVRDIASLPQTEDLSMTTNAFLLAPLAEDLYNAGLKRINISLDSLNADTFNRIIGKKGKDRWQKIWQSILKAHTIGFDPLKLNVVIIPGINDQEILDLAALTIEKNWHIRFIEFMPIGNGNLFQQKAWIPSETIRHQIRQKWGLWESKITGNGPADVFKIPSAQGTVGFISQMSECFCDRCNRIRLSADGSLRPCLLNEMAQIDLKSALRENLDLNIIRKKVADLLLIKSTINFKERNSGNAHNSYNRTMSQIGG